MRTWAMALGAALLLWLPEIFYPWNWREPGAGALPYLIDCTVFLLGYVIGGVVFLACGARVDAWLDARWPASPWLRFAVGAAATLAAVEAVYALLYLVVVPWAIGLHMSMAAFLRWAIHVAVVALVFHAWRSTSRAARERAAAITRLGAEADDLRATLASAELAILEMQVEPHFLFNTLAHVRRDLKQAPAEAMQMLSALIDYLERAGPAVRREDWTIADELDLVETYLSLIRHRFGRRLRFSIDAPRELRANQLPALAIATLVENAVQHGLAPKADGGEVCIRVSADASAPEGVCITVSDDGVGLRESHGLGLGLSTVRARLRAAFGHAASLTLETPGLDGVAGVRAAIRIAAHA